MREIVNENVDASAVNNVLDESLTEEDFFCNESRNLLTGMGLDEEEALTLLAHHKSSIKYGYDLSAKTLRRVFDLATKKANESPLFKLIKSPFFLMKTCWLYEHAPYFYFYGESSSKDIESLVIDFAELYQKDFLKNRVAVDAWKRSKNPRRVVATTFWESNIIDPILLIKKIKDFNLEGLELCIDFHPFNYSKLLPEELTKEKREMVKEACLRGGIKLDIHSPIVGPYTPSPDPSKGTQRFFNPTRCLEVQYDTIDLARDVGAGSVVFHLIDGNDLKKLAGLIERAGGSDLRITIENYCQTRERQTSEMFLACANEIYNSLTKEVRERNFGITMDLGHLNIDGQDPLVGAERIGSWCAQNNVYLRVHATDNYGNLLFSPPAFSADVHSNVSGRGVNNALVIKLLRSMGLQFDAVAEQIQPLTPEDIATINGAQTCQLDKTYASFVTEGRRSLSTAELGALIETDILGERAYQFLAGLEGVTALREYLVYRKIQEKKNLSVDEAKRISQEFIKMPQKLRADLTTYIDDLLLPIQGETGSIQKKVMDMVCHNISGAVFGAISNEHLNLIFDRDRIYQEGETICEQGSLGQEMFYLKEGEVAVYINGSALALLAPGEIFGEMSLFYNISKSATLKAASEKTKVGVLTRRRLENLFKTDQPYAHDLIYRLYRILPRRLRNLNDKYTSAIRALHLIFEGDEEKIPRLEQITIDIKHDQVDLFPTLSKDEITSIYSKMESFDAGQTVFSEGGKGDGAYFIVEGKVKVIAQSKDFKEILLGELGAGEIFGEMSLIDDSPRSATVVTRAPSKIAYIEKRPFNRFIETRSALAYRFMGFICLSLFRHILRLDKLYSDIKKNNHS
jgi:CRP-like cAMP-binding protein/sugar phosphate isomerase/epimerase